MTRKTLSSKEVTPRKPSAAPEPQPLQQGESESPRDYLLRIMRDPTIDEKRRDTAAKLLFEADTAESKQAPRKPQGVSVKKFGGEQ